MSHRLWGNICKHKDSQNTIIKQMIQSNMYMYICQFVQSLSRVQLFATPWTATHQGLLSITNSWGLLKLMSIESVMPSNHLILWGMKRCHTLSPPAFNLSQQQDLFQWVSSLHQMAKILALQLQHQSFQRIFRTHIHIYVVYDINRHWKDAHY